MIEERWGTLIDPPPTSSDTENETNFEKYSNDNEEDKVIADIEDSVDKNGTLIYQKVAYNKMLNTKVVLWLDEKVVT